MGAKLEDADVVCNVQRCKGKDNQQLFVFAERSCLLHDAVTMTTIIPAFTSSSSSSLLSLLLLTGFLPLLFELLVFLSSLVLFLFLLPLQSLAPLCFLVLLFLLLSLCSIAEDFDHYFRSALFAVWTIAVEYDLRSLFKRLAGYSFLILKASLQGRTPASKSPYRDTMATNTVSAHVLTAHSGIASEEQHKATRMSIRDFHNRGDFVCINMRV